jgi:hypothetical protein
MTSIRRHSALLFAVLAATALAVTTAAAGGMPVGSPGGAAFQADAPNASTNASITLANQTRDGRSVSVASATLPDGGFVVLEEAGPNGSVVGVSLPLGPGTHEGRVTLRGVPGATPNVTRLAANTTLVATLHRDSDGDGRFDGLVAPDTDGAYTANGTPVADRARVTVPPAERPTTPAIAFPNQTTNGTAVTVDSVTLPNGGYVGVHRGPYNASNATSSAIGATGYLEAGSYENVTVAVGTVPGVNATELNRRVRLSAVAYTDSDGDQRFRYVPSNGSDDEPYIEESPVNNTALVTVETPPNTTAPTGNTTTTPAGTNTTPGVNATTTPETATTRSENTTVVATTVPATTTPAGATTTPANTTIPANTTTVQRTSSATPTTTPTPVTDTPTETATPVADRTSEADHEATPYGAGSDGREGFLDNPLLPVLALTFAVFVVLVAVTGQ